MKVEWEVKDFREENKSPYGIILEKNKQYYLLGYNNGTGNNPVLVSLDDGSIFYKSQTVEQFVTMLNNEGYQPVFDFKRYRR